eukprot:scaffold26875_cov122-Cylindrotheca_fusiformis.AAC.2
MPQRIPISKCLLVGRIVYEQIRSDLSIAYVIDDGTGLIDCVSYSLIDDEYSLPSLQPTSAKRHDETTATIRLGGLVRLFAKIKNLAIDDGKVIRELQARAILPVQEAYNSNPEVDHWIACARFQASSTDSMRYPKRCLAELGGTIQSQVRAKRHLPSANDRSGEWRVFGTSCHCTCETLKKSLLYCHCQAKVLPNDPKFQFRDALLQHLLDLQQNHCKKLVVAYKDLKDDPHLRNVAEQQAMVGKVNKKVIQASLLPSTIRALVQDGILYHLDEETDEYLLITRELVMEPFVRDEIQITKNRKNFVDMEHAPPYLRHVDLEKLLYVKRCVLGSDDSDG